MAEKILVSRAGAAVSVVANKLTIYKLITRFPVLHHLNMDESANMIAESGFSIVKKENINIKHPGDRMPILYFVAELNM